MSIATLCLAITGFAHAENIPFLHEVFGLGSSANQYTVTMTETHTFKTLVVTEYNFISGGVCTGALAATETFQLPDEGITTFTAGTTYASSRDSSWAMITNSGYTADDWRGRCTRFVYTDVDGEEGVNRQFDCGAWYAGSLGGQNCTASNCGLNIGACSTDTW